MGKDPLRLSAKALAFFGQSGLRPGCYNDPDFRALEERTPTVLEDYAKFVLARSVDAADTRRARATIETVTSSIVAALTSSEAERQCVAVSNAVVKMLELLGIWCFSSIGSVRYRFRGKDAPEVQYSWIFDEQAFPGAVTGHAWVVAPPFKIVDCTARRQSWLNGEDTYIPDVILADDVQLEGFQRDVWAAPEHQARAIEPPTSFRKLWEWNQTATVITPSVRVTYQSHGIKMPDVELGDFRGTTIGGMSPRAFFDKLIRPAVAVLT